MHSVIVLHVRRQARFLEGVNRPRKPRGDEIFGKVNLGGTRHHIFKNVAGDLLQGTCIGRSLPVDAQGPVTVDMDADAQHCRRKSLPYDACISVRRTLWTRIKSVEVCTGPAARSAQNVQVAIAAAPRVDLVLILGTNNDIRVDLLKIATNILLVGPDARWDR